jgi:hypothetical protein
LFTEGVVLELLADGTFARGNLGISLIPSTNGGYLLVGDPPRCVLVKVDRYYSVQCDTSMLDTLNDDSREPITSWCMGSIQTEEGGYFVHARLLAYDDMSQLHDRGILVAKLDEEGNIDWQRRYEQGWENTFAGARRFGREQGILMRGLGVDVVKFDEQGNILGMQDYGFERVVSLLGLPQGGYVVIGNDQDARGGDEINARLVRADANGRTVWEKLFLVDRSLFESQGAQRHTYGSEARVLTQTEDGGFLVAGYIWQKAPDAMYKFWQVKLGREGAVEWEKTSDAEFVGREMVRTLDGGYLTAVCLLEDNEDCIGPQSASAVLKLDGQGSVVWQKVFHGGKDAKLTAVGQGPDGLYAAVGMAEPRGGGGDMEMWLVVLGERNAQ